MSEEKKRSPGRPKTGRQSPLEAKRVLLSTGGRILQYRIKPEANADLILLEQSGEFKTTTEALDFALRFTAKRHMRRL